MITDDTLKLFCLFDRAGTSKYDLHKIAIRGGYKYACDGRIAVRISTTEPDNGGTFPSLEDAFGKPVSKDGPFPEMDTEECEGCYGNGRNKIVCEDCKGEAYEVCPACGNEAPCKYCDGMGSRRGPDMCATCKGSGKQYEETVIEGYPIDGGYLSKIINNLPNCRITGVPSGEGCGFRVAFDGGDAIVMPKHKKD